MNNANVPMCPKRARTKRARSQQSAKKRAQSCPFRGTMGTFTQLPKKTTKNETNVPAQRAHSGHTFTTNSEHPQTVSTP